jgi:hypothetical protein
MAWVVAIVVVPLLFTLAAVYAVLKLAVLVLRIVFAPVVWLSRRPPRQRIELYRYERR